MLVIVYNCNVIEKSTNHSLSIANCVLHIFGGLIDCSRADKHLYYIVLRKLESHHRWSRTHTIKILEYLNLAICPKTYDRVASTQIYTNPRSIIVV